MISVIVPIYKVEEFLDECIQSIVDQTYQNLQIILVDDGSPDHCGEMCEDWAKKDKRIEVIHKKNGGLSDARNAGLAVATGDFVAFVGSDDWIEPQMYETMLISLIKEKADFVACALQIIALKERLSIQCLIKSEARKSFLDLFIRIQLFWFLLLINFTKNTVGIILGFQKGNFVKMHLQHICW